MDINDVARFLKDQIEEISLGSLPAPEISTNAAIIADLGLDSLDYAMLMLSGETKFDVKVNEATVDWRQVVTVYDLAMLLVNSSKTQ
jgi:acyl carrier protein